MFNLYRNTFNSRKFTYTEINYFISICTSMCIT
ncbi:unnamed protein product [Schistosoma mattheei]|uniref:Uncharacterized protein n=1 Tax=Schistosoma mattheei TaxID=31246 RepID=A0A183NF55_9TREM|nr:unnamed protein product [Schistosoma mattheei]